MPKPYTPNDKWSQKAAREGYRARSVYKLQELDERFRLLRPGMTVIDLGAAPGSWLQYVSKKIGPNGRAVGFDLQKITPIGTNVSLYEMDVTDEEAIESTLDSDGIAKADLVLSDIAPSTSGVKDVDQWKSLELARAVVSIARRHLGAGGRCVVKVFRGADFDDFLVELKKYWQDVRLVTVLASRDRSREVYVVMTK